GRLDVSDGGSTRVRRFPNRDQRSRRLVDRGCRRRPCAPVEPAELMQFFIDGVSDLPTLIKTDTFHRRAADGAHDALFLADEPVRDAPPNRTLDENHHTGDRNVE